jgi:hypothetical protein
MSHSLLAALLSAPLLLCASARDAVAQAPATPEPTRPPAQVLSFQPLQAIVGVFSGEYERVLRDGFTVGIGASYWDPGPIAGFDGGKFDARYVSGEAKLRYYPSEEPFRGFSLGLTAGGARATFEDADDDDPRQSVSGVKVGVEADYSWLLGRSDHLAVALGLGAKRVFFGAFGKRLAGTYPTSRIAIGWAF